MVQQVKQQGGVFIGHAVDASSHMPGGAKLLAVKDTQGSAGITDINR
jgi:hypothetical protein